MIGAQEKKIRRIMIAAPKSGSDKTMITCGLLQIFKENGEDISSCKCGPDYIDPMFHRQVLGIPARNLDTFFTGEDGTRSLFLSCLLYTSPSPRDAHESRMPSSA